MRLTILALFISLSVCGQQFNPVHTRLLNDWVLDGDTTISIPTHFDFKYTLAIECDTLTGTLDGTIAIKGKDKYLSKWVYMCLDTIPPSGCNILINQTNFTKYYKSSGIGVDSMQFVIKNNSITGGTMSLILRRY